MTVRVVDTTMRDGEQKAGVAFGINDKIKIAKYINEMGIYQIEAGIAAMGVDEKKSLEKIMKLGLKSKISSWNRMNVKDIQESVDCGVDIIHISVPSSKIQIQSKLKKSKNWIIDNMKKSIYFAKEKGFEVTIGLEDSSRADNEFLIELCKIAYNEGVKRIRYADTVGIMYPNKIFEEIKKIKEAIPIEIEVHTHNDFGMAIANSLGAVEAGAEYVDCTITGIGERAGNCDFLKFTKVYNQLINNNEGNSKIDEYREIQNKIINIIK